jgi:hypothetical protein
MVQAAVLDGLVFDASPFSQDGFAAPKVDVGRCQVADALVVAMVVVVVDEDGDGGFNLPCDEVLFQQDPVLQGLMPMGRIDWPSLAPQRSRLSRRP